MKFSSLAGHVLELFELIDKNSKPADRLAATFFHERKYLGSQDRRFIAGAVFGMIRHRRYLEALREQFILRHPDRSLADVSALPYLPLLTAYTIAVDASSIIKGEAVDHVRVAGEIWKTEFPGIEVLPFIEWVFNHQGLDVPDSDPAVRLGVKYSFQDWMVKEWIAALGPETEEMLRALNSPPHTTLRVNLLKTTREVCQERLRGEGIETVPTPLSPAGLSARKRFNTHSSKAFIDGWFEVQDEGSQLVGFCAQARPGDLVIDACAGAGGKSLHLAELMHNEGNIIAIDVDGHRLKELEARAMRAGITIIKTQQLSGPEQLIERADVVLVDAPCSGAGTIRRNPGMKWSISDKLVDHYAQKQKGLLEIDSQLVKPDGRLIYATCSLFRRENEDPSAAFLSAPPEFRLVMMEGLPFLPADLASNEGTLTLYPHRHDTDGFFVAAMQRAG